MRSDPTSRDRINSFSLVSYIPPPLASFLDNLRRELVPQTCHRAHVTVLPPRPLAIAADDAWRHIRALAPGFRAFEAALGEVQVFPVSGVVYLEIGPGADQLREMHAVFNSGALQAPEVFDFHPHVTLAQDIRADDAARIIDTARRCWAEFAGERRFCIDSVTFVQNTEANQWIDLGECRLGAPEMKLLEPLTAG